uniref:Uncharacterized protein n=1 Tax=Rhizophora mucronata TaxID=61149 RepID=A0A2P2KVW0_RHIMU
MEATNLVLKSLPWQTGHLPNHPKLFSFSSSLKSHLLFLNPSRFHYFSRLNQQKHQFFIWNNTTNGTAKPKTITKKRRTQKNSSNTITSGGSIRTRTTTYSRGGVVEVEEQQEKEKKVNVRALYQNGDPLGRKELGKSVVKWINLGMRAMASYFAAAEARGEFSELSQRMGPGLTFVIQAQPYLNAIPMPLGLEAICLKACTHYPTLFDHFQRELRDVLQELQSKGSVQNWCETESWKMLKELAHSAQHKAIARKASQPKPVQGVLGMDLQKAKAIQGRIDEFTQKMSELLRIERDAELEFTQEELDAVPTPDESSNVSRPIEFLVSHSQTQQELCDTICNLYAVSTSTGLGGMHLVLFRTEGNHKLPPTTLSPGDMVCVRTCDSRGAGATSCLQGFVNNLGEDGCSICLALESRHGDPTFSKLFGKSVRIDRIPGLADTVTYEVSGLF